MTPEEQVRTLLAKVLPWPQDGDEPAYVNIHVTSQRPGYAKPFWTGRAAQSLDEAVSAVRWLSSLKDTKDIYFCLSTQREASERVSKSGHPYKIPVRNQKNAVKLKSLFLDVDCKGGANGYPDLNAAVKAIGQFLKDAGLPQPSAIVRSGGGVHVYWTLQRALTPTEWQPLANALAEATKKYGLKCDTQVTIDSARILRVPGTNNCKTTPAKPVKLQGVANFDYSNDVIEKALTPYLVTIPNAAQAVLEDPSLFPPREPLKGKSELSTGIVSSGPSAPVDLDSVVPQCGFLRDAVTTGGKDNAQPLWMLTTTIASFCEDGRAKAHLMSKGHPTYQPTATDVLYDRVEREKVAKGFGWPSCTTISGTGAPQCASCPLFALGKSPLNHAKVAQPAVQLIKMPLPNGYNQQTDGCVIKLEVQTDGSTESRMVCDYPMSDPMLHDSEEYTLSFTTPDHEGRPRSVNMPTSKVGGQDMRGILAGHGLMLQEGQVKYMKEFLVSWIQTLQKTKDRVSSGAAFGWYSSKTSGKREGFVFNGTCYTPTGEKPGGRPDVELSNLFSPHGTMDVWKEASEFIANQERPELDAIVASAFAGPLVTFTGHRGLQMSGYSSKSGAGKSSALITALSVWGNPKHGAAGVNDTYMQVMHKISSLQAVTVYWDELKTHQESKKYVDLIFQMSSGKDRGRLRSNATARKVGGWETLLVSCSNDSLCEIVASQTKNTNAGVYRIFEFQVPKPLPTAKGQINGGTASRIIGALDRNFGHAGVEYAKFLGSQIKQVDHDIKDIVEKLYEELDVPSEERFWAALIGCLLQGATYANRLGFTRINVDNLKAFLLEQLARIRTEDAAQAGIENDDSMATTIGRFLSENRKRHTLVTERVHKGAGKPPPNSIKVDGRTDVQALDDVVIHIGISDGIIRVKRKPFADWLKEQGFQSNTFLDKLYKEYHVTKHLGRIGGGTQYADTVSDWYIEIPASGTDLDKYIGL